MPDDQTGRHLNRNLREGLRVSQASLVWTISAGSCAVALGIVGDSLVLVAFGLVGLLDSVGSGSLIVHFHQSQRHQLVSERHERMALVVVTVGMATVGMATIAYSAFRLSAHAASDPPFAGMVLTGVSAVVLAILATRKRHIATRIPSHALHADGWLSAIGAVLALVALAGTGLDVRFGWWWIDPVSASAVACGAVGLSVALARRSHLHRHSYP